MNPIALNPAALERATASDASNAPKIDEKAAKAAKQFESMMLQHMLEAMQKTAQLGGKDHQNSAYMSMATEALADGLERGGGLGLADLVAHSLQSELTAKQIPGGKP
jgi:Rod binding domain-containing protein